MTDEPEVLRSQMDQTRADLTDKLESLQTRVSEGLQATGTAVTETYTSVSGAVQSVSDALNFPQHVRRHPWLIVGGSFAIGYVAARWIGSTRRIPTVRRKTVPTAQPEATVSLPRAVTSPEQPTASGILLGLISDLATRALPMALDYIFASPPVTAPTSPVADTNEPTLPLSAQSQSPIEHMRTRRHF